MSLVYFVTSLSSPFRTAVISEIDVMSKVKKMFHTTEHFYCRVLVKLQLAPVLEHVIRRAELEGSLACRYIPFERMRGH